MKYSLIILTLLFFSCDFLDSDEIVNCPECKFPLGNYYNVYSRLNYNSIEEYENNLPSSVENDTLFIVETNQDYFLYFWTDGDGVKLIKNNGKLLLQLGYYKNDSPDDIFLYERPHVIADYNENYNPINTNDYIYYMIDSRTNTSITLNDTTYEAHLYSGRSVQSGENSVPFEETFYQKTYFQKGMFSYEGIIYDYPNQNVTGTRLFYQSQHALDVSFNFDHFLKPKKDDGISAE